MLRSAYFNPPAILFTVHYRRVGLKIYIQTLLPNTANAIAEDPIGNEDHVALQVETI
jgi:hypothetical protein